MYHSRSNIRNLTCIFHIGNSIKIFKQMSAQYITENIIFTYSKIIRYSHCTNILKMGFYVCMVVSVQFSSVAQSCPTLCKPMNRSTPGLPVHQKAGVHLNPCPLSWWCHPTISSSIVPFFSFPQSFPPLGSF